MELTTARLLLRPYREGDWQAVHRYAADPEVSLHQAWGPNTEDQTREFIRASISENEPPEGQRIAYHFALVLLATGRLIGGCTLRVTRPELREAMIGYSLGRAHWGQGYATEAARALLGFGFGTLGLHRITSWATPENVGSWRVMEKAGMRREGHEREAAFFKGRWRDWVRYAVLDHEWKHPWVDVDRSHKADSSAPSEAEAIRRVHQETGAAWDEAAAIYERDEAEQVALLRAGGTTLLDPERRTLGDLSPWCRRAVHLQCAGGSDTLSLLRQGASEAVGIDISERMVAVARRKAEALGAGARASWHRCDVLDAPPELDGTADLVYTGRGALPWVMDIRAWAGVVARLLAPGGRLFVFEGHPLDWVWDTGASEYRLDPERGDYFSRAPSDQRWPMPLLDGMGRAEGAPRARERQWALGDVLNALVGAGLLLERFEEHPDLYWGQFPRLPDDLARRLPHTFSLLMRKNAQRTKT